jgi:LytS/YehU family sensor histidine kinase
MLCISIVENVFKHGNTGNDNDIFEFSLNIDDSNTFHFHTVNHFDANRKKEEASGIGMVNMRRRLGLIYGNNASLTCYADGELYTVEMLIKLGSEIVPEIQTNQHIKTTAK